MWTKFSLALGWWAARWLAHIWVIRYLEESGLTPQEISWTSMWALVAALFASWRTSIHMSKVAWEINYLKFVDFDMKKGVLAWKKLHEFFSDLFGDMLIEDLDMKLKIVAADIISWDKIIFENWKIADALRASVSLPWVMAPYKMGDMELVDWWILSNLPIEVLDWKNVIAVSVLRDISRPIKKNVKILWYDFSKPFLWYSYEMLQKTTDIMMKQNEDRSLSSWKNVIYLHPEFPEIDYYEFHNHKKIIKIGYEEMYKIDLKNLIAKKFSHFSFFK